MKVATLSLVLFSLGALVAWFVGSTYTENRALATTPATSPTAIPIFATGIVEGASDPVEYRFETTGRIHEVRVEVGDSVKQDDILSVLDSEELTFRRTLALARLDQARAELAAAKQSRDDEIVIAQAAVDAKRAVLRRERQSLGRIEKLLANRATPQQQFDNQTANVRVIEAELTSLEAKLRLLEAPSKPERIQSLQAQIAAANAELELAELELRRTKLSTRSDGVVLQVDASAGELVGPHLPAPSFLLVDDSSLRIKAFIEEADAFRIAVGQRATVTPRSDLEMQSFSGRVVRLGPRFDAKKVLNRRPDERFDVRVRECWIEFDQSTPLVIGAHVDVRIQVGKRRPRTREVGFNESK